MSVSRLTTAAVLVLGVSVAFGQPEQVPQASPPTIVTVKEVRADRGELVCDLLVAERVEVTRTKVIEEKGVKKEVAEKTFVTRAVPTQVTFPLKASTFLTVGGKKVTDEDVAKRVTPGTLLFVSVGGKPDPAYLKVLRDDTLILVTPGWGIPPPPALPRGY
jgi:hypothetical protein